VHYIDSNTGATYPLAIPRWRGDSGGHVNLGAAQGLKRGDIDGSIRSLWRYRKALLVDAGDAVTMGEGWTPLVAGTWDRAVVDFKLDFMMPSGSFKDRGMTVMLTYLRSRGVTAVLEDS
jgi:threonine synthase